MGRKEKPLSFTPNANELGRRIRERRKQLGLSEIQLAVRAGFGNSGRSYISKLEHGQIQNPEKENLYKIATALEVSPEYLLYGPGEPERSPTNNGMGYWEQGLRWQEY